MPPLVCAMWNDDGSRPANKNWANRLSRTSICSHLFESIEMRTLSSKSQIRNRVLFFQSFERPRILENDFQLGAADETLPIDNETCGWCSFDQPLQTIPACLRNFP